MKVQNREQEVWVATEDDELFGQVEIELKDKEFSIHRVPTGGLDEPQHWRSCKSFPGAFLLDVRERIDWGTGVLQSMKRARVGSPIVVVANVLTEEFGTKIVSEGVGYCLLRDFAPNELRDVVVSLLKSSSRRRKGNDAYEARK